MHELNKNNKNFMSELNKNIDKINGERSDEVSGRL